MNNVPQFRFKIAHAILIAAVAGTIPFFQNCSNVGFTKNADSSGSNNGSGAGTGDATGNLNQNSCQNTQLQNLTTPVKILLVVDTSGSNQGDSSNAGTDPGKVMRAGSIQTFFNDFGAKANFNWGFITFQGNTASAILNYNNNGSTPAFTSSASTMQAAINYFKTVADSGTTPYQAAIQMAHNAITGDPGDTPQTKYIVVFLSDGLPTDYPSTTAGNQQIATDVQALVGLKAGRISFNTVYYGPADADASSRLSMMATAGGGQFLNTNTNPAAKDFLINNVVTVPGSTCPTQ